MNLTDVSTENGDRYYHWGDGKSYPSVTSILSCDPAKQQALRDWKARTPNWREIRDRAATVGSIAHYRILKDIAIRPIEPPEVDLSMVDDDLLTDVETACALFDELQLDFGRSPHVEVPIRSDGYEYSGRFDLLSEDGTLYDLKTSKATRESHFKQSAAYVMACRELPNLPDPDSAAVVLLNYRPDGMGADVERLDGDDIDYWFDEFVAVLEQYRGRFQG